jgi:hypothetical protein
MNTAMTDESDLASFHVPKPSNQNEETRWFDTVNAVSLTLATTSGVTLLAITMGSMWK